MSIRSPALLIHIFTFATLLATAAFAGDPPPGKIKVFLLVGQSNMQGKGSLEHLSQLVTSEPEKFGHLKRMASGLSETMHARCAHHST